MTKNLAMMTSQLNSTSITWNGLDLNSWIFIKMSLTKELQALDINRGIIKLLPKGDDKTQVKNWRPIALLNLSSKIVAKVLARRIVGLLNEFISPTQTGFMKGRFILENLITSWDAMHLAKSEGQNVVMLLLVFEKAYNRIEWPFVMGMLQAFGFPPYFWKWINNLLKDSSTIIDVYDELTQIITLQRSIRQGCPIAPALIVIAIGALFYILRAPQLGPPIKDITLPNQDTLLNALFADDIALFIELEVNNFDDMNNMLQLFCLVSRANVAPYKSSILGWHSSLPEWIVNRSWQWLGGPILL